MKMNDVIVAIGAAIIFLPLFGMATDLGAGIASLSYLGRMDLPRGIRNNNPGNIRRSSTKWKGKIPISSNTDASFEQFVAYVWGIRAMIKNLQSYQSNRGLNTLRQIISTWAPATENNTNSYIVSVGLSTGFGPDEKLNLYDYDTMKGIIKAMTKVENGRDAVTDEQFAYAWKIV